MIKEFASAWAENNEKLEAAIEKALEESKDGWVPLQYEDLLKLLIEEVINPHVIESEEPYTKLYNGLNANGVTVIDNGNYQGTLIFIIPLKTYQPTPAEYVVSHIFYGSCSGCDALLAAEGVEDRKKLCLHLLQNMKWLKEERADECK